MRGEAKIWLAARLNQMKTSAKLALKVVFTAIPIIATSAYCQQFNPASHVYESMPPAVMQPVQATLIAPRPASQAIGITSSNSNMSDSVKNCQNSVISSINQAKSSSDVQALIKPAAIQAQASTTWNDNRGVWRNDSLLNSCMLSSKTGLISDPCI